ncbi:hypothetical protein [Actinoplanes derwentensis]|uniref:Uncharacterized protein n=1 Tax=Actinoplanes derwentensis TaxID=113562 RepID=A0A1H2AE41_9ACTN|nr:hypothetical protein [Actinoplanes derwentensis]GID88230.1 hypothetical protein Ade03nite_71540 [Actinoplanes derwentensis]SDT44251.1 hypothetical protein SAMN04489716_3811 [Actinoplanes derwentensis]
MRIGPLEPGDRALGPDLARGFMLLFIALANTHYFVLGSAYLGGYPEGGTVADRMRRAGRRGPFETLTRRVAYGRSAGSGERPAAVGGRGRALGAANPG